MEKRYNPKVGQLFARARARADVQSLYDVTDGGSVKVRSKALDALEDANTAAVAARGLVDPGDTLTIETALDTASDASADQVAAFRTWVNGKAAPAYGGDSANDRLADLIQFAVANY